jgi:AcrR family transcriptional regulator
MENRFSARVMAQREREILEALLATFCQHGCFATTVDAVTARVGIGKASLYRHFNSRDELYRSALDYGINQLLARCTRIWDDVSRSADERLLAVVAELLSLNRRRDPLAPGTLLRLACGNHWRDGAPSGGEVVAALTPMVRQWQAAGLFDGAEDPAWIAAVLLVLVSSSFSTQAGAADQSPEKVAQRVVTLLLRGFPSRCATGPMSLSCPS